MRINHPFSICKIILIPLFSILIISTISAQIPSQKPLIKKVNRSYQWEIGEFVYVVGDDVLNGASLDLFGILGKAKLGKFAIGFDNSFGNKKYKDIITTLPTSYRIQDYGIAYIKYELMFSPYKTVYLSTNVKLGLGGITRELITPTTNGVEIYTGSESFSVIAPGISVVCNVFPNLGIGVNANYRITQSISAPSYSNTSDKHYAAGLFVRYTLNPYEYKNPAEIVK